METGTDFHGSVEVEMTSEVLSCGVRNFCCSIFEDQKKILEKTSKPGNGGVAQLGEHLPCKQGVMGSNPIISTSRKYRHPRSGKYSGELKLQTPIGMNGKNLNQMSKAEKRIGL